VQSSTVHPAPLTSAVRSSPDVAESTVSASKNKFELLVFELAGPPMLHSCYEYFSLNTAYRYSLKRHPSPPSRASYGNFKLSKYNCLINVNVRNLFNSHVTPLLPFNYSGFNTGRCTVFFCWTFFNSSRSTSKL